MKVIVESEIGALEHVLVHRPGPEIERMTQWELERLLFDDLLAPDAAGDEHDLLCEILTDTGATVHTLLDMLVAALGLATAADRMRFVERAAALEHVPQIAPGLAALDDEQLAHVLIEGADPADFDHLPASMASLAVSLSDADRLFFRPLPNLMFTRDPAFIVGCHLVTGHMATRTRAREALICTFALACGGLLDVPDVVLEDEPFGLIAIEGGDVMVLSAEALVIGCSQRTRPATVERLAHVLFEQTSNLQRVYGVFMPDARSVMHLDTILTHVDQQLFIGHTPLLDKSDRALRVAVIERTVPPKMTGGTVLDALRAELGADVELVPCGGDSPLYQEREQWTDGANALALSPGHIVLYSRNRRTIAALAERGFTQVQLHSTMSHTERTERITAGRGAERAVYAFSGGELSRARGGGRCLTMPLVRRSLTT